MNNLKFRAWSVQNKQMYYAAPYRGYLTTNGNWWDIRNGDDVEVASSEYDDKLMQYTGLKDKNGVEIYEGDIVLMTMTDGKVYAAEIMFENGMFCAMRNTTGIVYLINSSKALKVIGNVYQHPKLLKEREQIISNIYEDSKLPKEREDKIRLEINDNIVWHISPDSEICFLVKDINQKETVVSISEFHRVLKNIETSVERDIYE